MLLEHEVQSLELPDVHARRGNSTIEPRGQFYEMPYIIQMVDFRSTTMVDFCSTENEGLAYIILR